MNIEETDEATKAVKEFARKERIFNQPDLDDILKICAEAKLSSAEGTEYQEQVSSGLKELLTGSPYNDHDGLTLSQIESKDRDALMQPLDKLECAYHLLTSIRALVGVVGGLIQRVSREVNVEAKTEWRNAYGGYGRVVAEFKKYFHDVRGQATSPDLVVVVTDANCKGYNERSKVLSIDRNSVPPVVCAIPDPHIERWLLLDGAAFKKVFGRGFRAPKKKCERDFYKKILSDAYIDVEADPSIGGIECARRIVSEIDLDRAADADDSFQRFIDDLRRVLKGDFL